MMQERLVNICNQWMHEQHGGEEHMTLATAVPFQLIAATYDMSILLGSLLL